jgi:hypothetical protein
MADETKRLDDLVTGIRDGVAAAVRDAYARGLPVFESDEMTIYATYPDGRRIAVERLPTEPLDSGPRAA